MKNTISRPTGSLLKILMLLCLFLVNATACTTLVIQHDGRLLFARNLDWISGTGLVIINPRNLQKQALGDSSRHPARWVARYGSVTFNQVGRELPFGGINEAGLVVEHMTLDCTIYPARDSRPSISAFQWIQFQLDNYATVEDVINSDKFLRIEDGRSKIHFLVCDRRGHSAVIEFLDGRMVCRTGAELPVRALANSTYDESIRSFGGNGGNRSNPSLDHFCTAAKRAADADTSTHASAVDYAFHSLRMVSQGLFTKWSIVYDITAMQVYFKIYETPAIVGVNKIFRKQPPYDPPTKVVELSEIDFGRGIEAQVLDLDDPHDNTVNPYFVKYSAAINKAFISKAFEFYKGWGIDVTLKDTEIDGLSKYPESFRCIETE
ncbi:MAG: linear amide C-N hydrolase [Acidobacteriota bacterium]